MTTKQIDDIKRLLAEATPGPWALHNETCVSSGDTMTAQTCDDEPENTPQAEQNAALIVAAVNALPDLLADLDEVIRDRNEWADSTRGANQRMREAEERVKLLLCDLEAAQRRLVREAVMATRYANEAGALEGQLDDARKREQVLREALLEIAQAEVDSYVSVNELCNIARKAIADTEVWP